LPLGLFCATKYTIRHIPLDLGDRLYLYSDGITEARDPEGNEYEEEQLISYLRGHSEGDAMAMVDGVLGDVARFRRTAPQQDDMTLLAVWRRF
jgi:sigma-B regulation protein RsbU (phosphoserine phosphatase)